MNIGVIGSGWVAKNRHIPCFKRIPGVNVQALYNPLDNDSANTIATHFNIPSVHQDENDFFLSGLDAVTICSPPFAHEAAARNAIENKIHVLCEKPICMEYREARNLINLANEKQVLFVAGHNFRHGYGFTRAKRLIEAGSIGQIKGVQGIQVSSWQRPLPNWIPELPGGLFFDEAPHFLYLFEDLLGPLDVQNVQYRSYQKGEAEERLNVELEGAEGWGDIIMWTGAPVSEWLLFISGSQGALVVDLFRDICVRISKEKVKRYFMFTRLANIGASAAFQVVKLLAGRCKHGKLMFGTNRLVEKFCNDVRMAREREIDNSSEGAEVVKHLNEIVNSIEGLAPPDSVNMTFR